MGNNIKHMGISPENHVLLGLLELIAKISRRGSGIRASWCEKKKIDKAEFFFFFFFFWGGDYSGLKEHIET